MARFVDYRVMCDEHNCPMIQIGGSYECLFDFVDGHLGGLTVTDLVPDSGEDRPGALVFSDGHTLPLLCPHCAKAARLEDPEALMAQVAGLSLVALEYVEDEEGRSLLLLLAADPEADLESEETELLEVATHPESARRLTCPQERRARYRHKS
jgi:hypothetical protein